MTDYHTDGTIAVSYTHLEVSKKDIENDDYYIRGDYIGKQGIEKSYEKYLRGEKGVEKMCIRDRLKEQLDRVMEEWDAATVELENH